MDINAPVAGGSASPSAVLIHLEGEVHGRDAGPVRHAAFPADTARYRALWGEAADGHPFLNPNLVATDNELCPAPLRLQSQARR